MLPIMHSTKSARMILLYLAKWLPGPKIEKNLKTTSPGPQVEIQNNFTEKLLILPYTKIA